MCTCPPIQTRRAAESDVAPIVELVRVPAAGGAVLPRTPEDIRGHLPNFLVAELPDGPLAGCVALRDFGQGLEEIRTLIVDPRWQSLGIGTHLVRAAVDLARSRRTTRVFALTVRASVFLKLGFRVVPKTDFPAKVWSDCRLCPKRECCDETAVVLELE